MRIAEIFFPLGIPFSWLQLTSSKVRFLTASSGVAFSTILMLLQLGFYDGILDQVVHPIKAMNGEVIMVSKQFEQLAASGSFSKRRAVQAKSLKEVEDVFPLYTTLCFIQDPVSNENKEIFVFAFDPADDVFTDPGIRLNRKILQNEEYVLFDEYSEKIYGPVLEIFRKDGKVGTELENTHLIIKGLFRMGSTLAAKGHIAMSDLFFLRIFKNRAPNMVNIAVIKLKPGADPDAVAAELQALFPQDIRVFTKEAFCKREQCYWRDRTPIGFVVSAGMIVAMVVGALVVYQILFTDVSSHLPEYATLKAIGIRDSFFFKTIIEESLILMIFGIVPGILASMLMYHFAREITNMPIYMSWSKIAVVSALIFTTCMLAGLCSTKELRSADPAEIF